MADTYAALYPAFWDGDTGAELRRAGPPAQVLAVYLISNRFANVIGLYRLRLADMVRDTGVRGRALERALAALPASGFAEWDAQTGGVWVRSAARFRLQLRPGQALAVTDKRVKWVNAQYAAAVESPYLGPFFDAYAGLLHLTDRRDGRGIEGACKPCTCTGTSTERAVHTNGAETGAGPARGRNAVEVVRALAVSLIAQAPAMAGDYGTLKELVKTGCAQRAIPYDAAIVGDAIDQALAIAAKPRRPRRH